MDRVEKQIEELRIGHFNGVLPRMDIWEWLKYKGIGKRALERLEQMGLIFNPFEGKWWWEIDRRTWYFLKKYCEQKRISIHYGRECALSEEEFRKAISSGDFNPRTIGNCGRKSYLHVCQVMRVKPFYDFPEKQRKMRKEWIFDPYTGERITR